MPMGPPLFLSRRKATLEEGNLSLLFHGTHKKIPAVLATADCLVFDEKYLYLAGQDAGQIFVYDWFGRLLISLPMGEHIADLLILNDSLYAISYHDNRLFQVSDLRLTASVNLPAVPEKMLVLRESLLVLCHDGCYSYLVMLSQNLETLHAVILERSLWKMENSNGRLLLNNGEISLFFNECLTLCKSKKRTAQNE